MVIARQSQIRRVQRFFFAALAPFLPKAVRVRFGKWAIVRFFRAARAAFLMFLRAAIRLGDAITSVS